MIVAVLVIFILVLCVSYWSHDRKLKDLAKTIPGPKGIPVFGNALMFLGKPNEVLKRLHQLSLDYKRVLGLWLGPKFVAILFDARDVEVLLRDRRAIEKSDEYKFLKPWLGDSILISAGTRFRTNKKIMMPAFHANGIKNHLELFNKHARGLVKILSAELGKGEFDVQNYLYRTMLSELLETTLGVNHETLGSDNLVKYGIAVSKLCKIMHIRSYKMWLRFDILFKFSKLKQMQDQALAIVHPLTEKVIAKRKLELCSVATNSDKNNSHSEKNDETGEHSLADANTIAENIEHKPEISNLAKTIKARKAVLLDLLLQSTTPEGRPLTEQEIKDEVLTIMFAGQDTTSVTVGFMLSLLGLHPDIQDKAYEELKEIFGDSDRFATIEDLQRMEYLERVMQETWRLYPPIPVIARKPTEDIPLDTYTLPKGCTVAIITMILHRNADFFENPHQFDPDNFLPEKVKARHPYAFIPFSGGVRTCVGGKYAVINIKVLLSTLLRNYKFSSTILQKDYKLVAETTLKRKEGFLISLEPRHPTEEAVNQNESENNIRREVDINANNVKY